MNMLKHTIASLAVASASVLPAAVPEISGVEMKQDDGRRVTITYTLSNEPAVVTLDVQTNAVTDAGADDSGWISIGGEAVWNAMGDVWRKVDVGNKTITWRPDHTWPDHKIDGNRVRAVVTAWATNNTPDYMVVDITGVPAADVVRYYPGVDFLPKKNFAQAGAAVTNNPDYKTTKLLMRKIMARGVEWAMGASSVENVSGYEYSAANETPHLATLDSNYYIGVFEVTQRQLAYITVGTYAPPFYFPVNGDMRPADGRGFCYNSLRLVSASSPHTTTTDDILLNYSWPNAPCPSSVLGLLRDKTKLDFDLPSQAQWEFACRAGNGFGYWGDGSIITSGGTCANLGKLARYNKYASPDSTWDETKGPAIVGTYRPNSWGLYDMHGNMIEYCLDWAQGSYSTLTDADGELLAGRVNIDPENPVKALTGATVGNGISGHRAVKGGSWQSLASRCRASYGQGRYPNMGTSYNGAYGSHYAYELGFRLVCTAGLE